MLVSSGKLGLESEALLKFSNNVTGFYGKEAKNSVCIKRHRHRTGRGSHPLCHHIPMDYIEAMLHPQLDKSKAGTPIGKGLPASPGGATGNVVFSALEAEARAAEGEKVLLVRIETSPEDLRGMAAAQGILTARGGMTSHAAVVTRQMGKPCVCGLGELTVDLK